MRKRVGEALAPSHEHAVEVARREPLHCAQADEKEARGQQRSPRDRSDADALSLQRGSQRRSCVWGAEVGAGQHLSPRTPLSRAREPRAVACPRRPQRQLQQCTPCVWGQIMLLHASMHCLRHDLPEGKGSNFSHCTQRSVVGRRVGGLAEETSVSAD